MRSLGEAFSVGYRAACAALVPGLRGRATLCATEEGGAHPRAIATELRDGRVTGKKKWSTLATDAEVLLVVASEGRDGDRNRLRVVTVDPHAPGVTITPMPPTPFTPDILHAEVTFDHAPVGEVLPGDGYLDYLKPFRTTEDIHVHAAVLDWMRELFANAHELVEEIAAMQHALRALAAAPQLAPETHVALAGAIALTRGIVARAPWASLPDEDRRRWERDRALLDIAGKARAARREAAWAVLTNVRSPDE